LSVAAALARRSTGIVAQLHTALAALALAVVAVLGIEAALRAWRGTARPDWVERLEQLVLLLLVIVSAGGLGLLLGGPGPHEQLHLVYAVLAMGSLPIADSLTRNAQPRRRAVVTAVTALVVLILIGRLFQTG
jgi:hypothetical protein